MYLPRFNRHWHRRRTKPAEQIYDAAPYETQVIEVSFDTAEAEAERELKLANEQLKLQSQYPGRSRIPDNIITITTRRSTP